MILLAPHIAAFLQQRLPIERRASPNTCDSWTKPLRGIRVARPLKGNLARTVESDPAFH
jgi:hypothetical protein